MSANIMNDLSLKQAVDLIDLEKVLTEQIKEIKTGSEIREAILSFEVWGKRVEVHLLTTSDEDDFLL